MTTNGAYNGVYGINSDGGNGMRGDSNGAITSGVYGENTGGGFGEAVDGVIWVLVNPQ